MEFDRPKGVAMHFDIAPLIEAETAAKGRVYWRNRICFGFTGERVPLGFLHYMVLLRGLTNKTYTTYKKDYLFKNN
ncbi:MAG: hypothetical protein FH762_10065 [Firmicutes bacterium]|nr:hypothetical protein [Bacillota bacterium]